MHFDTIAQMTGPSNTLESGVKEGNNNTIKSISTKKKRRKEDVQGVIRDLSLP